jgi:hypothetical protein
MRTPKSLTALVAEWRADRKPQQEAFRWHRDRWVDRVPEARALIAALPDKVDRDDVRAACVGASESPDAACSAFVAAMVWGYGWNVGYGPWRTRRVLDQTPNASERLARVASCLREQGAIEAYRLLGGGARLKYLGPAFGTKYLYFCPQAPSGPPALILDRVVAAWLREHANLGLNPVPWSPANYESYLDHVASWADKLGVQADVIERLVWQAQMDSTTRKTSVLAWKRR